jgi:MFS transporter, PHS family, inorganic phosphate transporter
VHPKSTPGAGESEAGEGSLVQNLDEVPIGRFHRRTVVISGMGFFTDAYDLFVISTVAALVSAQWKLSTAETSLVTGAAILGAFFGAVIVGRMADIFGRKRAYVAVAITMVVGALASAAAPNLAFLVAMRFVLGIGIGGDYPVSAVLMSEYSNRANRGRLVGLVFSMQALGLIVGPLVGLVLLSSGIGNQATWRLLLAFGAIPAAVVIYLRSRMPESPRFTALVRGDQQQAANDLAAYSDGAVKAVTAVSVGTQRLRLGEFLRSRRNLLLLLGTAGAWFFFDYAYYGNTLSLPVILKEVDPSASIEAKLAWSLIMFVIFALPGYLLAVWKMDRIGHRRLQFIGFAVMSLCFAVLGGFSVLTATVVPFLAIFGLSYFFVEFGPNTTTFVLPSEVFPVSMRTTGHGTAAGIGKLGAFIGVFLVPFLQEHVGLQGMLGVAAAASVAGFAITFLLPEPAQRTLEEVSGELQLMSSGDRHRASNPDTDGPNALPAPTPQSDDAVAS